MGWRHAGCTSHCTTALNVNEDCDKSSGSSTLNDNIDFYETISRVTRDYGQTDTGVRVEYTDLYMVVNMGSATASVNRINIAAGFLVDARRFLCSHIPILFASCTQPISGISRIHLFFYLFIDLDILRFLHTRLNYDTRILTMSRIRLESNRRIHSWNRINKTKWFLGPRFRGRERTHIATECAHDLVHVVGSGWDRWKHAPRGTQFQSSLTLSICTIICST